MFLWLWCSGDPELLSECSVVIGREVECECESESSEEEDGDGIFRVIADRQTEGPRFIVKRRKGKDKGRIRPGYIE